MINVAWDHNSYYHERLLRALPARCGRVLDVGCGAGRFAARLAERADRVDALDRSPAMIAEARRIVPANVTWRMPQPPERRVSKSTAIAWMVSLPASDRSHLHQPQKPAVSNLHWQEQPRPPSKTIKAGTAATAD